MQFSQTKKTQKTLTRKIMRPFLFSIFMFAICYFLFKDKLPNNLSKTEWDNFTENISFTINTLQTYKIILFVMSLQLIHTACMIPFVDISQMLMGYFVGFLFGGTVCFVWECCIVFCFIYVSRNRTVDFYDLKFPIFVAYLRQQHLLYTFIFLVFCSSFPLNSTCFIIVSGDVTFFEYMCVHCIVSCLNVYKNTYIGYNASLSITADDIIVYEYIVLFFTIFPILLTLFVVNAVGNFYAYLDNKDNTQIQSISVLGTHIHIDKKWYYFFFSISNTSHQLLLYFCKIISKKKHINNQCTKTDQPCNQDNFAYLLADLVNF